MTKKKDEPFSHSRWNEPLKPHLVVKSECSPEMYEVIHQDLLECLKKVNEDTKATIIMVTHDAFSASYSKKVYMLSDGEIKCQLNRGNDRKEFYGKIIDLLATLGGAK